MFVFNPSPKALDKSGTLILEIVKIVKILLMRCMLNHKFSAIANPINEKERKT